MKNLNLLKDEFIVALLQVDRIKAAEIFDKFSSKASKSILENMIVSAMEQIGHGWEKGTISLAQVYMSGVICEELIDKYLPAKGISRKDIPKMGIAVLQDYHVLGKRIVCSVLRSGGYELTDYGHGLGPDEVVENVEKDKPEILLISTLMLSSALKVKEVIEKLALRGIKVKVIVGGAPFRLDRELWKTVGADANGKNASDIIKIIERMVTA
jgi:monomethylamine corrinoid protein